MTILINHKYRNLKKNPKNLVLFVDEKFNLSGLKKNISKTEFFYISDLLRTRDLKKKILSFKINSKKTIFLISIKKEFKTSDVESLGASFHSHVNYENKEDYFVNTDTINSKIENFIGYFLLGLKLKSYEFKFYKSKEDRKYISINVIGGKNKL